MPFLQYNTLNSINPSARMTKEHYVYRHCTCRNRITSHRRVSSETERSNKSKEESIPTLVCEECGTVKETTGPVRDERSISDTDA